MAAASVFMAAAAARQRRATAAFLPPLPPAVRAITTVREGPDSPTALIDCATLIADSHSPAALPVLVDILGYNNPIAAAVAVNALSRPETAAAATPLLLQGVAAFNYSVNAYALRALGALRDGGVAPVVVAAATGGPIPNVRRAAAAALARLDVPDVGGVWATLRGVAAEAEGDWSVRYAAVAAMEEFGVRGVGAAAQEGGAERDAAFELLRDLAGRERTGGPVDAVAARAQLALLALEGGGA
ncbi:hypothetical protein MMPV_004998 [Pyropia vietnamensis]